MADVEAILAQVTAAPSWDARVSVLRRVPEMFGVARHAEIFGAVAKRAYVSALAPDFAYVHWLADYELEPLVATYDKAHELTDGFSSVGVGELAVALEAEPRTLRVFRLMLGFTAQEFASATTVVAERSHVQALGVATIRSLEAGRAARPAVARCCSLVIADAMSGNLFPTPPPGGVRSKGDKPDTVAGWETIRGYASEGVPLPVLLHQRLYGGAFRQLLDATSTRRGDVPEDAVEGLFTANAVPYIRTGSHNQQEIEQRFGLTVKPAPDFVVYGSGSGAVEAILECKGANDGGTARDKAARFRALRTEATRLGGFPVLAVLAGLGWMRTGDALGPVVQATDGRVFTLPVLGEMLTVQPFPRLVGTAATGVDPPPREA